MSKSESKTVGELIEELSKFDKDTRVLFAINQSAGFDSDHFDVYPIECVYERKVVGEPFREKGCIRTGDAPLCGYCFVEEPELYPDDGDVVILYCFP